MISQRTILLAVCLCAALGLGYKFCFQDGKPIKLNCAQVLAQTPQVAEITGGVSVKQSKLARQIEGKVTRVSDGDTIYVTPANGVREKIRLNRIDAPESKQEFGAESGAYLKSRIYGKTVRVEYKERDRYGRVLGIVFLGDEDINLEMVKTGHAWHYARYDKTPAYIAAQEEARAAKRGLWANPNPLNPERYRHGGKVTAINVPSSQTAAQPISIQPSGGTLPCVEYRNAGNGAMDQRIAAPVNATWPETGYWLNTNSKVRHNSTCPNYRKTRGYPCHKGDGKPCGKCGG